MCPRDSSFLSVQVNCQRVDKIKIHLWFPFEFRRESKKDRVLALEFSTTRIWAMIRKLVRSIMIPMSDYQI